MGYNEDYEKEISEKDKKDFNALSSEKIDEYYNEKEDDSVDKYYREITGSDESGFGESDEGGASDDSYEE